MYDMGWDIKEEKLTCRSPHMELSICEIEDEYYQRCPAETDLMDRWAYR